MGSGWGLVMGRTTAPSHSCDRECSEDKQLGGSPGVLWKWPGGEGRAEHRHGFFISTTWVDGLKEGEWGGGGSGGAGLPTSEELLMSTDCANTDLLVDHIHAAEAGEIGPGRWGHPTGPPPHQGAPTHPWH